MCVLSELVKISQNYGFQLSLQNVTFDPELYTWSSQIYYAQNIIQLPKMILQTTCLVTVISCIQALIKVDIFLDNGTMALLLIQILHI